MFIFKKLICLFLFMGLGITAQASENYENLFIKANEAYTEGDYQSALSYYNEIKQAGYTSSELEYNIGNSYNKLGKKAKALLSYERALLLEPNDKDIVHNRDFTARSLGKESKESMAKLEGFLKIIFKIMNNKSLLVLLILANFLFFILLALKLFYFKKIKLYYLILVALILLSSVLEHNLRRKRILTMAMVMSEEAAIFYEPNENSTVYFKVTAGEKIKIIKSEQSWTKVLVNGNKKGWINQKDIESLVL